MKHALLVLTLLAAGCGSDEPPAPEKPAQGRGETQTIRNTQAVGTSGGAVADKVDAGIKANEEQVRKAERESEEQPE